MDRIYLDEASEAPLLPEATEAMLKWIGHSADPSRAYGEAMAARDAIERARRTIAETVAAQPRELIFTSSATEALNWLVDATSRTGNCLAVSAVEHSAVYDSAQRLATEGCARMRVIGVNHHGMIDLDELANLMSGEEPPETVFVQHANHEIGTVQPVSDAAEICHRFDARLIVDAAMTAGRIVTTLENTGADALVMSAHKAGGPPGIGAVAFRRGFRIRPMFLGGSQERARRAGPENVAAIAGFGAAVEVAGADLEIEAARQSRLSDELRASIEASIPDVEFLGDPASRLPHVVSMQVRGVQGEPIVLGLDQAGFAVHSGSACSSEILEPSRILEAIGVESRENLRISVGRSTTGDFIEPLVAELSRIVARLRQLAE